MRSAWAGPRWVPAWLGWLAALLVIAVAAISAALAVTPMQTVTVAGQDIQVGTAAPHLTWTGPGEVDLFGQSLPTTLTFTGPVRPKLRLSRITINSELTTFVQGTRTAAATQALGSALASGWLRYFGWEAAIAGAAALVGAGALAGWRRLPRRTTVRLLAAGLLVTEALNAGAIMAGAYRVPAALRHVHSLSQLAGDTPVAVPARPAGRPLPGVQAVVLGDSTAAGAGLPLPAHPSRPDRDCGRSADAYAAILASANGWHVVNAACDSATIRHGLLGPEVRGHRHLPPQIAMARRAGHAVAVVVSVGADDLNWAGMVMYCALAPRCDDRATTAFFQQQLAAFSKDYLQLLSELATLPGHPRVIVNRYYDPFGPASTCLARAGLTAAKVRTLQSRLATLNTVIAKGASQFGFASPMPDFTGHQLCSAQPYVQGLRSPAPFHPTALGQFAIALADQAALHASIAPATAPPVTPAAGAASPAGARGPQALTPGTG
jgi:hypothetical protein